MVTDSERAMAWVRLIAEIAEADPDDEELFALNDPFSGSAIRYKKLLDEFAAVRRERDAEWSAAAGKVVSDWNYTKMSNCKRSNLDALNALIKEVK